MKGLHLVSKTATESQNYGGWKVASWIV